MEEMLRNRLPRKKYIAERELATETELKALIREYKAKDDAETVKVLEDGLEALRAYKAELKLKAETDELGVEDITVA